MIMVYKYLNGLTHNIINTIFKLRQNLRNFYIFECQNPKIKKFGLDNIAYRPSQPWKNGPEEVRNSILLPVFKESIKKVPLISCSCNCFKKYGHHYSLAPYPHQIFKIFLTLYATLY